MSNLQGALPAQQIEKLIEIGCIKGAQSEHVSPASLDLTISEELYEIEGLILPQAGEKINDDVLKLMGARRASLAALFHIMSPHLLL